MNGCVYKTVDGKCLKYSSETTTSYCVDIPDECISVLCEDRKLTNADQIRAMTDEELAKWLDKTRTYIYIAGQLNAKAESLPSDYDGWLDWLRKEAKE